MTKQLAIGLFFTLLATSVAASDPPAAPAAATAPATIPGPARVKEIADVEQYIGHTRDIVALAQKGEYGRLKPAQFEQVADAQRDIELLFGNRKGTVSLTDDEQIRLGNDQEVINALIRADDKSRVICTRMVGTGTRLTAKECLTVAQREARAEQARRASTEMQRSIGCPQVNGQCTK